MINIVSIYITLFIASFILLAMIKLISEELINMVDKKFIEFTNQIDKLEKENEQLKKMNNTFKNKKLNFVPIGCFH